MKTLNIFNFIQKIDNFAVSRNFFINCLLLLVGVCAGVAACRSGLTKLVSMEEQGKLNSVVCALQEIMLLLVTIICNSIYKATLLITPSFTLYFLGGLSIVPVLLSLVMKMYERKESDIVMPGY